MMQSRENGILVGIADKDFVMSYIAEQRRRPGGLNNSGDRYGINHTNCERVIGCLE